MASINGFDFSKYDVGGTQKGDKAGDKKLTGGAKKSSTKNKTSNTYQKLLVLRFSKKVTSIIEN